ncbi:MAG: N-acetyltransferase [Alphaproteobacteria bacterium]|nr:N-acetyltransferase [Alphaproteobacteria bacterium]
MNVTLHDATVHDIPEIERIYTFYVLNTFSSFEETPPTADELDHRRTTIQNSNFPYIVAKLDDKVIGYAYVVHYRTRSAYRYTVEHSIYVDKDFRTKGIGDILLTEILKRCRKQGLKQIIAVISGDINTNRASIALHEKHGFKKVAHLHKVGLKFNQWVDSILLQHSLDE